MLTSKSIQPRRARREKIHALSEALKEIEALFEMMGFGSTPEDATQPSKELQEPGDLEDGYGEDEDSLASIIFQREEIEVAIDVFLSELARERVIPKYEHGKSPSLEGIFEKIFGEKHKIIEAVQAFEEHIEGYFDLVGYEDVRIAFAELSKIRDILDEELANDASEQGV